MATSTLSASQDLVMSGFRALAEPLRLKVVDLLRQQEFCVCDLCEQLQVNQSKLSFHIKVLKEAQLIRGRQEGRWIYYSLNLPQIAVLEQYLSDVRRHSPMLPPRVCHE